ncbi:hypothetical protein KJ660_03435 [Candidatus Micrarchaeota archaeon]|nr:hypothetical protein [Candidatus Micrarchaeota archaeon]
MERELEETIKDTIIDKLNRRSYWGRRLINFDDLFSWFKLKASKREIEKTCDELFSEGILWKKKGIRKCFRYSLNPKNKREIELRLEKIYRELI